MPSILVTPTKGLFQQTGTTALPSGSISGHKSVLKTATSSGTTTLTAADSGKVILVEQNAAAVVLPAVAAGLQFTFIYNEVYSSAASTVTTAGTANYIGGGVSGALMITASSSNHILSSASGQVAGDHFSVVCDGTNWLVYGMFATTNTSFAFSGS